MTICFWRKAPKTIKKYIVNLNTKDGTKDGNKEGPFEHSNKDEAINRARLHLEKVAVQEGGVVEIHKTKSLVFGGGVTVGVKLPKQVTFSSSDAAETVIEIAKQTREVVASAFVIEIEEPAPAPKKAD